MVRFLLARFVQMVLSLIFMSLVVFALSRAAGDPVAVLLPETATIEERQAFRAEQGLDKPIPTQYLLWASKAVRGDLGRSVLAGIPVTEMLRERIAGSAELAFSGLLVSLLVGVVGGVYSAARHKSRFDYLARVFASMGQSMPSFWLGIMLILVFGVWLHILPAGGADEPTSIILPALTLGLVTGAGVLRLTRSSMLEVLDKEYIKVARIKGLSETEILWKHALKNAAPVVLTYAGLILFALLTGTIVVEQVFGWPGIGSLLFNSVFSRDFPVVQGGVLLVTLVYLIGNFLVDIGYAVLNPRIQLAKS